MRKSVVRRAPLRVPPLAKLALMTARKRNKEGKEDRNE